jgi:hypothetical protein
MNQRQRSLQIGNGVPEPRVFLQQIQNVCEVLVTKYMVVGLLNIVRIVVIVYHNGRVVAVVVVDRVVTVGVVTDVRGGRLADFFMNTQILSMFEHFSAQLTSKSRCTAATMSFCVMFEEQFLTYSAKPLTVLLDRIPTLPNSAFNSYNFIVCYIHKGLISDIGTNVTMINNQFQGVWWFTWGCPFFVTIPITLHVSRITALSTREHFYTITRIHFLKIIYHPP